MHVVVRFLCTVSVGLCVGSVSAQSKFDKLLEVLADRDNCIAAVERDISEIEMSETLDTKRLFVSLLAGLPTQAREALKRAAVSSEAELPNFSDGQIGGIAYDGLLAGCRKTHTVLRHNIGDQLQASGSDAQSRRSATWYVLLRVR